MMLFTPAMKSGDIASTAASSSRITSYTPEGGALKGVDGVVLGELVAVGMLVGAVNESVA
jgi:hypothetical protein